MIPRIRLISHAISTTLFLLVCDQSRLIHGLSTSSSSSSSNFSNSLVEAFSVAPMMGHTNRHYRYMFRQLSTRAHLYTEMIPASQIVQVFEMAAAAATMAPSSPNNRKKISYNHPDDLLETVYAIRQQAKAGNNFSLDVKFYNILSELMMNEQQQQMNDPRMAIQLGGRDPNTLAKATAIATAFGYSQINLNCGCPSISVSGRGRQQQQQQQQSYSSGAALMKEPEVVAQCLEAMSIAAASAFFESGSSITNTPTLSVKHRLGVADINTYNNNDDDDDDEAAYESCHEFCRLITMAGNVSKLHIHARIALLGLQQQENNNNNDDDDDNGSNKKATTLWTPNNNNNNSNNIATRTTTKVDHKRVQYMAKRQARQITIQNRSIPPLRPQVVDRMADAFPTLEIISNGGIQSIDDIHDRLQKKNNNNKGVSGVMVGRAAINHPCSFAQVDSVLSWNEDSIIAAKPSRRQVLEQYIEYCKEQEDQFQIVFPKNSRSHGEIQQQEFRKKLVAVPFHLFMGENGNNQYQRRLRKLVNSKARRADYSASSMLIAAMQELPIETLEKSVEDYTPWDSIETFDFTKRSGAMQRTIY